MPGLPLGPRMRSKVQVVFDTPNPDKLARFYAAALGYELQGWSEKDEKLV